MVDKRCPARITDHSGFHTYACAKKASTPDGYCRTHDPELRRQRRLARGPTAWEREMAAKKAERERIEGIEADNAALRARIALLEREAQRMLAAIDAMSGMVCQAEDLLVLDGPATEFHAATGGLRAALDAAKEAGDG